MTITTNTAVTTKSTIVFVPGAWHSPDCFSQVSNSLQSHGYRTVLVSLPSVGNPAITDPGPDVAAIQHAITVCADAGEQVLLFMHSRGGIPGSNAVAGLTLHDRAAAGKPRTGVAALFYCAAWMLAEDECILDKVGERSERARSDDPHVVLAPLGGPAAALYNDLDQSTEQQQQQVWTARLQQHAFDLVYGEKVIYAAWRHLATTYLLCKHDRAVKYEMQLKLVARAQADAEAVGFRTETLNAGHSPFLSVPESVVAAVRRAAGEEGV